MKKILGILLFISFWTFGQEVEVNLTSPYHTVYTHMHFLEEGSYDPAKSSRAIYGHRGEEGEDLAIKIQKVLKGKGLIVDFNKIPKDRNFKDTIDGQLTSQYTIFPYRFPELTVVKRSGYWYYSDDIVDQINDIYLEIYPKYSEEIQRYIPEWGHKKFLGMQLWQIAGILVIILLCFIFFSILNKLIFFILQKTQYLITHKASAQITAALRKLSRPIVLVALASIVKAVIPVFQFDVDVNNFLFLSIEIAITIFWIFVFIKLVNVVVSVYAYYAQRTESKLDDQLIPIIRDFLHILVVIAGVLHMVTLFGVNPTTVLTGASIGGLAVALAAQDTVKNLIGTVMIFLDKPFHIGDWIEAGEVVGTVEKVGFRSTIVRASNTSIYQIPNSALSEMVVNNFGLRAYRLYRTELGIRYDTPPEKIEEFVEGIREIVRTHPETRKDAYNIEFTGFGDSALLIFVNIYLPTRAWDTELAAKHSINMLILNLSYKIGVDFAFPSQTLMIEQFPHRKIAPESE